MLQNGNVFGFESTLNLLGFDGSNVPVLAWTVVQFVTFIFCPWNATAVLPAGEFLGTNPPVEPLFKHKYVFKSCPGFGLLKSAVKSRVTAVAHVHSAGLLVEFTGGNYIISKSYAGWTKLP